jgi:peptide/nickel transport system substrate-binding protein
LDSADKALVEKSVRKGYSRREALSQMAATPKKGGTIRVPASLHGPDDKLDPAQFTSAIDYTRGRAHYNGLCQHDSNLVAQPELAESFGPNANASEWSFKLRKDLSFHDGSKFTADDARFGV